MTATRLRALHVAGDPVVLPNVWDADTARLVEEAGFPVVATSSRAVAAALGYADGQGAPVSEMFAAAARIARVVSVPVTVDAESGYDLSPHELVGRLSDIGAVGCNIEDTDHARDELRPVTAQTELLAAIRAEAGQDLVINARIDVFLGADDPDAVLPRAIERARAYLEAGADCVYPILLRSPRVLAEFVKAVSPAAVNSSHLPGVDLASLGVARISLGAGLWRDTRSWLATHLDQLPGGRGRS